MLKALAGAGFALQLCVLRYPGRLLSPGEFVPPAVVGFIGRQLDLDGDELADYAVRSETRHEHLAELRRLYGFRSFSGGAARELGAAVFARKNAGLEIPAEFLAHISPHGWEHINLTGEYRWPSTDSPSGRRRLA